MTMMRRTFTFGTAAAAALAAARPARAQKKFRLRFGSEFLPTHPAAARMIEATDKIRTDTNGTVDIQVFPSNQLGGESDMESQVRSGALDFMTTSGVLLQTIAPTAGVNGMPFIFKDYDTVWKAMDGDLGGFIRESIGKVGLYSFPKMVDNGFREITTSNRPITSPEDLKGLKIRVPVTPLWVSSFRALGASPTTMNLGELYSALQTKVVDGQENPLVQIDTFRMFEVQKYCSMTNHVWDGNWIIANARKWATLPKELQDVVSTNFGTAAVQQRADIFKLNNELAASLQGHGMIFNTPDPAPFRATLEKAGFYADWKAKYGPEAWSKLEQYVGVLS